MELLRFAVLTLGSPSGAWNKFSLEHEGVRVAHIEGLSLSSQRIAVGAIVELDERPELCADGLVEVPEEARRKAEAALEVAADVLSVATGGSRAISSPSLPVAFRAEDPAGGHIFGALP